VIVDEDNHSMEVVVQDDQLSLAIGKRGQNVRLASRLTGWRLDVVGETKYNDALKDGYRSLTDLEGVGEKLATQLYEIDIKSASDLASATLSDLESISDLPQEDAEELIRNAENYMKNMDQAEEDSPESDEIPDESDTQSIEPDIEDVEDIEHDTENIDPDVVDMKTDKGKDSIAENDLDG
jgi:N utilization substance protein A